MPKPTEFKLSDGSQAILDYTLSNMMPHWMKNFSDNFNDIKRGKNLGDLIRTTGLGGKPAIIVGAGPSVHENKHLDLLASSGWRGLILSTDRMLKQCLEHKIEPDFTCTVDGSKLISEFYTDLPKIKTKFLLCATTTHPEVVKKIKDSGNEIYWFLSLLDNPLNNILSLTGAMHFMTEGKFILQTPAQVGTTLWNFAFCLECNPIILIGFNFGYSDLNHEKSLYYPYFLDYCGGDKNKVKEFYKIGKNPHFHNLYLVDGVWLMYKEIFMILINSAPVETVNATEAGSLWGGKINSMKFSEALKKYEV